MKKMLSFAAAVIFAAAVTASPVNSPVSKEALNAFERAFKDASNVQWKGKEGLYIASFELNNEKVTAWFTEEGELEAVERSITQDQLPLLVARAVAAINDEAVVTTIKEVNQSGELFYLAKSQTDKHMITYKISADGSVTTFAKKKK